MRKTPPKHCKHCNGSGFLIFYMELIHVFRFTCTDCGKNVFVKGSELLGEIKKDWKDSLKGSDKDERPVT